MHSSLILIRLNTSICAALFFNGFSLYSVWQVFPCSVWSTLIHSFLASRVDYCNAVFAVAPTAKVAAYQGRSQDFRVGGRAPKAREARRLRRRRGRVRGGGVPLPAGEGSGETWILQIHRFCKHQDATLDYKTELTRNGYRSGSLIEI